MPLHLETEPRDLLLDDNDDIVIDTDLHWATGIDAIAQECRIALSMFRGEWFLDLDAGMPYFQEILGAKPDVAIAIARSEITDALLAVDGVTQVTKLLVDYGPTRRLSITWQVMTAFGETPVDTLSPGASS